jgi:molecular chaperone DnaK (HSP70)
MGHKFAIDFGTTNTVIARWNDRLGEPEIVSLPGLTTRLDQDIPPLVPSLLYVHDGRAGQVSLGQAIRDNQLDQQRDNRLFRNFKRGIVASPSPDPRPIDAVLWGDRDAGRSFVRRVIESFPVPWDEVDQLVLTAPVASFEGYLEWLNGVIDEIAPEKIRVVDESTAAALGYAVTKPGAVVLVFDFGGGTLDLSLVQLPESREKTGGFLRRLLRGQSSQHAAKVIAKAGRIIGGSDIDQWLLAEVLHRVGLTAHSLGSAYSALLTRCEEAKIALSTVEQTDISFEAAETSHRVTITRPELEAILEANGFYSSLRRAVDKVMHVAHQRGIFKEDIHHVLMVGGTSLMPSVQRALGHYFHQMAVHAHKPFTSVAEGALQVAAGYGLEDYLAHSYGIRHLDPHTNSHAYDEIIPMGSRYPSDQPVEVILSAAHDAQREVEFVIGEIDSEAVAMIEVQYENGQAVFVAQANQAEQKIIPLNEARALEFLARLEPSGKPGEDRLRAEFRVDDRRQLRLKITDLHSQKILLNDVVVAALH